MVCDSSVYSNVSRETSITLWLLFDWQVGFLKALGLSCLKCAIRFRSSFDLGQLASLLEHLQFHFWGFNPELTSTLRPNMRFWIWKKIWTVYLRVFCWVIKRPPFSGYLLSFWDFRPPLSFGVCFTWNIRFCHPLPSGLKMLHCLVTKSIGETLVIWLVGELWIVFYVSRETMKLISSDSSSFLVLWLVLTYVLEPVFISDFWMLFLMFHVKHWSITILINPSSSKYVLHSEVVR